MEHLPVRFHSEHRQSHRPFLPTHMPRTKCHDHSRSQLLDYVHHEQHLKQLHLVSNQNQSEEHTSELQSHLNLVCRLLLEKKKTRLRVRIKLNEHTSAIRSIGPDIYQRPLEIC